MVFKRKSDSWVFPSIKSTTLLYHEVNCIYVFHSVTSSSRSNPSNELIEWYNRIIQIIIKKESEDFDDLSENPTVGYFHRSNKVLYYTMKFIAFTFSVISSSRSNPYNENELDVGFEWNILYINELGSSCSISKPTALESIIQRYPPTYLFSKS